MCVHVSHIYTRVSLPPQTPILETFVKKEASSNINTVFPELYLHKDRKLYSNIYYKKPGKSNQNVVAVAQTKHRNMVRVNENTDLNKFFPFICLSEIMGSTTNRCRSKRLGFTYMKYIS